MPRVVAPTYASNRMVDDGAAPIEHRRRLGLPRLRFGLKTMLVVTTLLSVWLGYNAYVVRHRQALRRMIEVEHLVLLEYETRPAPRLPAVRRWLGDVAVQTIILANDGDMDAVRDAFPEATVTVAPSFVPSEIYDPLSMPIEPRRGDERWHMAPVGPKPDF